MPNWPWKNGNNMNHQHVFFPHSVFRVTFLQTAMDITDIIPCGVTAHQKHHEHDKGRLKYEHLRISKPECQFDSMFSRFCSSSSLPAWLGFFLWRQQGTALGLSGSVHVQTLCRGVAQLAARGALRHSTANVCTKTCSYPPWQAWKWHDMAWPLGPRSAFVPPTSFRSSKAIHLRRSAHEDRLLISTAVSGLLH